MSQNNKYILAKQIGRGGMAEIFLAKAMGSDGFDRLCVIKKILPHYADDKEFLQMFRDEANICRGLRHANIVAVESFEKVEGTYAIVMEFVNGSDLRSLLFNSEQAEKRLTIPMCCQIIADTARGLHYAHRKTDEVTQKPLGIVHRDVSPQNILISYEGEVKITDFGIADADNKMTETRPGVVKGKYSYMSPEQIKAENVDARSDIFALTVILWEMLAMKRLFHSRNDVETIQKVRNCDVSVEIEDLEVDEDLKNIIRKGMAPKAKNRYSEAAKFEKKLRSYISRKYPDYSPSNLSVYVKDVLSKKRSEITKVITQTLTQTNQKPSLESIKDTKVLPVNISAINTTNKSLPLNTNFNTMNQHNTTSNITYGHSAIKKSFPPRQKKTFSFGTLIVTTLIIMFGYSGYNYYSAKRSFARLVLRTQPNRIKVKLNNKYINKGKYLSASTKTPLNIILKPGKNKLQLFREGYASFKYVFKIKKGEIVNKKNIVLKKKKKFANIIIKNIGKRAFYIDINNGFFVSKLRASKNSILAPDLIVNKKYKFKIYKDKRNIKSALKCMISSNSRNWKNKTIISINLAKRKCYSKESAK